MELIWQVKKTTSVEATAGKPKNSTETTEVKYIVPGELDEESAQRMRMEFATMISAMFGGSELPELVD